MTFVCPLCKGPLFVDQDFRCGPCGKTFPIRCGIPDFRIYPDPYISIQDDWQKGERLWQESKCRSFEQLLQFYYEITPEVPAALSRRYVAHTLEQVRIAQDALRAAGFARGRTLLDVGCSTGGLLAASHGLYETQVGLDVAFRWLIVAQARMAEIGLKPLLVCGNAEALPFPEKSFSAITLIDVLEHVRDAEAALRETHRVLESGAKLLCETNNRYALRPDPQLNIWGVGYLPRRLQANYVAARRKGIHVYHVQMRSTREVATLCRRAQFESFHVDAAPLFAPHIKSRLIQRMFAGYNSLRTWPALRGIASLFGPRVRAVATK